MLIASFGKKTFTVSSKRVYTLSDLSYSGELRVDTQEVDKAKPSTYIKGPGLEKLSFTVPLNAALGVHVRYEIDVWRRIRDAGKPEVLLIGGVLLSNNKWLLTSVDATDIELGGNATYLKAKLNLTFEEFVRFGKKEAATAKGATATKASTKTQATKKSIEYYQNLYKQDKKRNNANASKAIAAGPLLASPKI